MMDIIDCQSVQSLTDILSHLHYDIQQNTITSELSFSLENDEVLENVLTRWNSKLTNIQIETIDKESLIEKLTIFKSEILEEDISDIIGGLGRSYCSTKMKNYLDLINKVVKIVGNELINFFLFQVIFYEFTTIDTLKIYLKNLVWSKKGKINLLETAIRIIDHTDLSIMEKYGLACNLCIEEKIQDMKNDLPEDIETLCGDEEDHRLVVFWTYDSKDQADKKDLNFFMVLMEWSISHHKEAAVQYIWENFNVKEILFEVMDYTINLDSNENILFYFFKQMDENQLRYLSAKMNFILLKILHDRTSDFDTKFVSEYVLELIKTKNHYEAFDIYLFCRQENFIDSEKYLIFNEFQVHFKKDVERDYIYFCEKYLSKIFAISDTFVAHELLKMGTPVDRRHLIYSESMISLCCLQLYHFGLARLDIFISLFLGNGGFKDFKKVLFEIIGFDICKRLVIDGNYSLMDEILNAFPLALSKWEFKKELIFKNNTDILLTIFKNKDAFMLLKQIDRFLSWCFEGNAKKIAHCKAVLFEPFANYSKEYNGFREEFLKVLTELTSQKNWSLMEKYWQWIFHIYEVHRHAPNLILRCISSIIYSTWDKMYYSSYMRCVRIYSLENLIMSCYKNGQFVGLGNTIQCSDILLLIARDLLKEDWFDVIDTVLDLCFYSNQSKIHYFKRRFILSFGCRLLYELIEKEDKDKISSLMTWCKLNECEMKMMRKSFESYALNKNKSFFPNVDYIWAMWSNGENSNEEQDWVIVHEKRKDEDGWEVEQYFKQLGQLLLA